MGKRRQGREAAVQYLYHCDLQGIHSLEPMQEFWSAHEAAAGTRKFAAELAAGVLEHLEELDALLQKHAANYSVGRIAAVDRNVLRLAIYEMLYCEDVPPVVIVNEAIEIAKRLGSEESGRFVNGILQNVMRDLDRPLRTPAKKN